MPILQLFEPQSCTFTYMVYDPATRHAAVIDAVDSMLQRDLAVLREHRLTVAYVIESHTHADHITSAAKLVELTGAVAAAPAGCGSHAALQLNHGDVLAFGGLQLRNLHTPGHTAGSVCLRLSLNEGVNEGVNPTEHVFTGDTLLIGGCGRTDFQSGSASALYRSVTEQLFSLAADTVVWPGHDYRGHTQSTIGTERQSNPRFLFSTPTGTVRSTEAQFVDLMATLNLPQPKRIHEAVPANLNLALTDTMTSERYTVQPAPDYAGDISPELALQWMQSGQAVMVDIRSEAERAWVGFVPGVASVMYKIWPGMAVNPEFETQLQAAAARDKKLLLLCRSGQRSVPAAKRAAELGYEAYNILEGFEGDPNDHAHRNTVGGWRFLGLPWRQN